MTAGLNKDPDRLVVVKKRGCDWGACGRPRRRETGLSNQGCDWGACGRSRRRDLATSLALRDGRGEGRTRTRARPSRLRAIAGRMPRDEMRPSGGEIAEKRLWGAKCAGIEMLPAERSSMKVHMFTRALRGGPLWRPTASLAGCMRCQVLL